VRSPLSLLLIVRHVGQSMQRLGWSKLNIDTPRAEKTAEVRRMSFGTAQRGEHEGTNTNGEYVNAGVSIRVLRISVSEYLIVGQRKSFEALAQ